MVDNTPHDINAASQRMRHDLVNKAYEASLPAQSELDKINDAFDKDLQVTLVDQIKANDQLTEIRVTLKQLRVLEAEKQADREHVSLNEAISFARKKEDQLIEAQTKSTLKAVGGTLTGLGVGGPAGAVIGADVGGTVAYADIEHARKAVDTARDNKRRVEERLQGNERDLRKVKSDLEGLEKQQREISEELKMLERRKQEIKQRKEQLASLSGYIDGYHYITNRNDGAVIGADVGGTVAYADIEHARKAVDTARDNKRRVEERLQGNERDLRKVKSDLEGLEKQQREISEELKMLERRKQEIKQRKFSLS